MRTSGRVAVEVGSTALRIAVAGADGAPVLIADLPRAGPAAPADLPGALAALMPERPAELVLVHPARWTAARVARWAAAGAVRADRVRTLAVPVAVAAPGCGVLDVGRSGAEASLVGADGRPGAVRWCPAGGDALDAATAALARLPTPAARRLREALSLEPAAELAGTALAAHTLRPALAAVLEPAVAAMRALTAGPVVLVGGVARTPLLAELLDAAGTGPLTVPPRPEVAAVLGAARGRPVPRARLAAPPARPDLLPPPARRRGRRATVAVTTVAAAALLLAAAAARTPRGPAAPPPDALVQYGYELRVPTGWAHTGGLPERRRSVLTPVGAPAGSDLVAVERTPLGYDADAEPERAVAELRAAFAAAVADGVPLTGFDPAAELAGRPVVGYRQAGPGDRTAVHWYVVLDGDAQFSVGCRHTPAGREVVAAACAAVVASVRRTG